tara:strand:- start:1309 stop:2265 length:957 start_codon:yes stop_codon:yes gene_type:complete
MAIAEALLRLIKELTPREEYAKLIRKEFGLSVNVADLERPPNFQLEQGVLYAEALAFEMLATGQRYPLNNFLWHRMLESLRGNHFEGIDLYVGEVLRSSFNAAYLPTKTGYLVLLHRGLGLFLYRTAVLFIGACSFRFGGDRAGPVFEQGYARTEFTNHLEAIFTDQHLNPLPLQSIPHLRIALALTEMLESWVLAHELGHIIGHRESVMTPHEAEFSADAYGFELYRTTLPNYLQHECEHHLDYIIRSIHVAAPHMFFHLGRLLELFHPQELKDTHPPANERSGCLWGKNTEDGVTTEHAERLLSAFVKFTEPNRGL